MNKTTRRRFYSHLKKEKSGCWVWRSTIVWNGYGRMWYCGQGIRAHRMSWMLHRGPIPKGLWVLHKCDNPPCVNPDHLFVGTRSDNMRDAKRKGRAFHPSTDRPECLPRGETSHFSKLKEKQVLQILNLLYAGVRVCEIVDLTGIKNQTISNIKNNHTWKHIPRKTNLLTDAGIGEGE